MSASSTMTIQSPWATGPSDPHHLKRRHTRGKSGQTSLRPRSSSPSSSSTPFSFSGKRGFGSWDDDNSIPDINSSPSIEDLSSHKKMTATTITATSRNESADLDLIDRPTVPSWFGSLRSFAISAGSSSRGAFTPLLPPSLPSKSKNKSSSLTSSSSSSSSSSSPRRSRSKGRSSSIYYASTLDDPDSDDEWGTDSYQDEPITSKNGLKENRVRGPRMSWALLDPSLGGILPQPYKTVPGFEPEPEPELSSPSTSDSSCESSLPSPSSLSNMEGRTVSEIRCRENNDDGDTYDIEYTDPVDDTGESDLVRKNSKSKASLSAGAISSTSSPFALIKSYVPSLPTFNDPTSGSTAGAEKRTSGTGGFWSMRRLSMNLLNNNQYAQLDTPETANKERTSYAVEGQEEDEEGVMEEETQGYSRYKDDDTLCDTKVDSYKRFSGSNFRKEKGSTNRPTSLVVSPTTTSNSYFASMLNSASNAVSSKGSKAKKIGRSD